MIDATDATDTAALPLKEHLQRFAMRQRACRALVDDVLPATTAQIAHLNITGLYCGGLRSAPCPRAFTLEAS